MADLEKATGKDLKRERQERLAEEEAARAQAEREAKKKEQEAKNEERVAAVNAVINPLSWNVPALPARDPASIAYATHHGQLDKVSRTVVERADRGFPVFR